MSKLLLEIGRNARALSHYYIIIGYISSIFSAFKREWNIPETFCSNSPLGSNLVFCVIKRPCPQN